MSKKIDRFYDTYKDYGTSLYQEIRKETYGEDIGQNSWITADEFRYFLSLLNLSSSVRLLEVASGSGGPGIFTVMKTGCDYVGIDVNEKGIANARRLVSDNGLQAKMKFELADASASLPFPQEAFDAVICIDSINHLHDRPHVLHEFHRVLKKSGRILFTDPIVVTGILTNEEIVIRSSLGYFLFAPKGENERLLKDTGFRDVTVKDVTDNIIAISAKWYAAREKRKSALLEFEEAEKFDGVQAFLQTTQILSSERRLSRIMYSAVK